MAPSGAAAEVAVADRELRERSERLRLLAQARDEHTASLLPSSEITFGVSLAIDEARGRVEPELWRHPVVRIAALRVGLDARGRVQHVRPAHLDAMTASPGLLPPEVGLEVLALWHGARALERRVFGPPRETEAVLLPPVPGSGTLLSTLFEVARCHVNDIGGPRLMRGPARTGHPQWRLASNGRQDLVLAPLPGEPPWAVLPVVPLHYVNTQTGTFGLLRSEIGDEVALELTTALSVPASLSSAVPDEVRASLTSAGLPLPLPLRRGAPEAIVPIASVRLTGRDAFGGRVPQVELWFAYGGVRVRPGEPGDEVMHLVGDTLHPSPRAHAFERAAIARLRELGAPERVDATATVADQEAWIAFARDAVPRLRAEGFDVTVEDSFEWTAVEIDGWYGATEDADAGEWFLELGVLVGGERINILPAVVEAIRDGRITRERLQVEHATVLLPLADGRRVRVEGARLQAIVDVLVELHDHDRSPRDKLRLSSLDAARLDALTDVAWELSPRVQQAVARLREGPVSVALPTALRAELREYQRHGFEWLQWLREAGLGGILADDMGLGKTVQALTHLLAEHEAGRMKAPALVVVPRSVLRNWAREAERFTPGLRVLVYHGRDRHAALANGEHQLVVTTYALLQRDEVLQQQRWHTVVLDEAQAIKNPTTKVALAAMKLNAQQRLAMTGTPMENHLGELWSLTSFVNPGLLGNRRQFTQWYRTPIERDGEVGRFDALCRRIAPFMLRRTKTQVLTELPPKTEVVMYAALDDRERDLYESVRLTMEERVRKELVARGLAKSQIVVLDALLKLRQVCCHAPLTKLAAARAITRGSKLTLLLDLLEQLAAEGRRTLVFSQFTSMLEVIGKELHALEIRWSTITGRTSDRQRVVDEFQQGNVAVMLVSLKAGGTGLNLTAADTVIHYDPWWNPAVEAQASDRAHRIGQDKPVTVYRLICEGTVEERMVALQERKAALGRGIQESAQRRTQGGHRLDERDIAALLAPLGELDLPE
ncbi:MAG: DEAD/DEAH box helicase [Deltaproteobacteria bacterium]|nr:DEAD/DEAH box helicase [Deltaproteobacteria bacterium]MBK8717501.1 DEAD/DEAH box helicase [Deltaproteobacteria bacterium]MBP7289579.1 DEAD/DEAH box helicase [Nannocystaceae bacterium]